MTEFEMLLACYRSGQMSERQWQAHLEDRAFREWVEDQNPINGEPVAWWVHDLHVARQPVKARARYPEPTEFLYPASREQDARNAAKMLGGKCTPLFAHPALAKSEVLL